MESELGVIESEQERIDIGLVVATGAGMPLPVAFVFGDLSAQFPVLLDMAFCVYVHGFAIFQEISPLPHCIKLSYLYLSLYRRKGSFTI